MQPASKYPLPEPGNNLTQSKYHAIFRTDCQGLASRMDAKSYSDLGLFIGACPMRYQGSVRAPNPRLPILQTVATALLMLLAAFSAHASRYFYDANGRVVGVVNDSGQAARYQYDAVGNLIEVAVPSGQPVVFAMQPNRGPVGTQVQVSGYTLPTVAGQQVLFNGTTAAAIMSATSEQIEFTVPAVATGAYAVTLTTASSPITLGNFQVTTSLALPTIASVSHACAPFDTTVSLTGTGFDINPGATRVEVGGRLAKITAITQTTLSFRTPLHTPGGPVRVITEAGAAQSNSVLYLVSSVGSPCTGLTPGVELQADGAVVNAQFSTANKVTEYAFYAERGQWLSVHFSNPTATNLYVAARVLAPEARAHPLLDVAGSQYETWQLRDEQLSIHMMPIATTGYHVLELTMTAGTALGLDVKLVNVPVVQKGAIVTYQAAPGQWLRMRYAAQVGDQLGVGLHAENTTPETMFSSIYTQTLDHKLVTPEIGSVAGANEGSNSAINVKTYASAGDYAYIWYPQNSASVAQATIWFNDDRRPQLQPNIPQQIAITKIGQNARFPVQASAGGGFSLNVRNLVLTPATASLNFWLYAPDGSRVSTKLTHASSSSYFGAPGALITAFDLPMTGIYTAMLDPQSAATAVSGQIVLDPGIDLPINGPPRQASSSGSGSAARFTINGTAGQKLGVGLKNIVLAPATANTWLGVKLYLPSGDQVAGTSLATCYAQSPSVPGCEVDLGPLPVSGTYVVTVEGSTNMTSASYEIQATADFGLSLNENPQPVAITRYGGNARLYFEGVPGSAKTIHIDGQVTGPVGQQVHYTVLRPDGFPLVAPLYTGVFTAGSGPITLRIGDFPLAGIYTVFVDPQYAATAQFNAKISAGVLDDSQIPTQVSVVPGPWFYRTITAAANSHTGVGVTIQSLTNPSGTMKIEMVDPQYRRVLDYDSTQPHAQCTTTNQLYCDFDLVNVYSPGVYQAVVWPGTPRREDAALTISQVFDQETTQRNTAFSLAAGQNGRLNFTAQSNEALKLVLTRQTSTYPATDVWFYLLDALGNQIGNGLLSYSGNTVTWNLPALPIAGSYSIVIDTRYGTPVSLQAQLLAQ
jgi:large repetitive protein